jgi:hypothetical protein
MAEEQPSFLRRTIKRQVTIDSDAAAYLSVGDKCGFCICVRSASCRRVVAAAKAATSAAFAAAASTFGGRNVVDCILERLWTAKRLKEVCSPDPEQRQMQQRPLQEAKAAELQRTPFPGHRSLCKQSKPGRMQQQQPEQQEQQQQEWQPNRVWPAFSATPGPGLQLAAPPTALHTRRQLQQQLCPPEQAAAGGNLRQCLQDTPKPQDQCNQQPGVSRQAQQVQDLFGEGGSLKRFL